MDEFGKVLGVKEVWHYLMGSKPTRGSAFPRESIRTWMKSGVIPSFLVRGQLCSLRADVDAFLIRIAREGEPRLDIIPVQSLPSGQFSPIGQQISGAQHRRNAVSGSM